MSRSRFVVERFTAEALLAAASGFLEATAGESNLALGILSSLRFDPTPRPDAFLAAIQEAAEGPGAADDVGIQLVAVRTPPENLVLSAGRTLEAVDALVDALASEHASLPGVIGPREMTSRFVGLWSARTGLRARVAMHERSHRLDRLVPIPPDRMPNGRPRPADEDDLALVTDWLGAFMAEALPDAPPRDPAGDARRWLTAPTRTLWLWERDERVVSLAGLNRATTTVCRIDPVYTPPAERGRGYAAAVTSAASEPGLAGGATCYLFTNLANATANGVYRRLGYLPAGDFDAYRFEVPGATDAGR